MSKRQESLEVVSPEPIQFQIGDTVYVKSFDPMIDILYATAEAIEVAGLDDDLPEHESPEEMRLEALSLIGSFGGYYTVVEIRPNQQNQYGLNIHGKTRFFNLTSLERYQPIEDITKGTEEPSGNIDLSTPPKSRQELLSITDWDAVVNMLQIQEGVFNAVGVETTEDMEPICIIIQNHPLLKNIQTKIVDFGSEPFANQENYRNQLVPRVPNRYEPVTFSKSDVLRESALCYPRLIGRGLTHASKKGLIWFELPSDGILHICYSKLTNNVESPYLYSHPTIFL